MTTNEILDALAENESKLFYAFCRDPKNEGLKMAHEAAKKALYTGNIGDGKIFVYSVENAIKVRTGQEGFDALQGVEE